jgi:hypothetical protein
MKNELRYIEQGSDQHPVTVQQISLAHTPAMQFGRVSSTLSESLNGVLKAGRYRFYPVFKMVAALASREVSVLEERYRRVQDLAKSGNIMPPRPTSSRTLSPAEVLASAVDKGRKLIVVVALESTQCGEVMSESVPGRNHTVDLLQKKCSCRRFQVLGVPCKHAAALCVVLKVDPHSLVQLALTTKRMLEAYTASAPFATISTVDLDKDELLPPPVSAQRGRPRKPTKKLAPRIPNAGEEPRTTSLSVKRCGRCHQPGHYKSTCKSPLP